MDYGRLEVALMKILFVKTLHLSPLYAIPLCSSPFSFTPSSFEAANPQLESQKKIYPTSVHGLTAGERTPGAPLRSEGLPGRRELLRRQRPSAAGVRGESGRVAEASVS